MSYKVPSSHLRRQTRETTVTYSGLSEKVSIESNYWGKIVQFSKNTLNLTDKRANVIVKHFAHCYKELLGVHEADHQFMPD